MTPAQLSRTVLHAVRRAAADGEFGPSPVSAEASQQVTVASPPRRGQGDYAVSIAFRLAGPAGMTPYDVARVLRDRIAGQDGIRAVEITGGGFLNVTLDDRARADLVAELGRGAQHTSGPGTFPLGTNAPAISVADTPAADIARWSAVTGDAPAALALRTPQANPLFRVQYAHARARALSRNARDLGFRGDPHVPGPGADSPYGPRGGALLALLADHRRVSERSGAAGHARHLVAVSDAFFDFNERCPSLPKGDEKPGAAHRARLALVEATGTVLAGGLALLGVGAPAHI